MNLIEFDKPDTIYIDANIFLYVILKNPEYKNSCKTFLKRVEKGKIHAVISPLVVDEVTFKIIVETLKDSLKFMSNTSVLKEVEREPSILKSVTPSLFTFLFIIQNYKGLKIVSAPSFAGIKLFSHIIEDNLLPRDALYLSIMEQHNIKHIATVIFILKQYRLSQSGNHDNFAFLNV